MVESPAISGLGELLHLGAVMVRDSGPLQRKRIAVHAKCVLLPPGERGELCLELPPLSAKFVDVAHGKSLLWSGVHERKRRPPATRTSRAA